MDITSLITMVLKQMECPEKDFNKMILQVTNKMNQFYPIQKVKHFNATGMTQMVATCVARICLEEVAKEEYNATVKNWDALNWGAIADGRSFVDENKEWKTIEEIKAMFRRQIPFRGRMTIVGDYFERGILQKA